MSAGNGDHERHKQGVGVLLGLVLGDGILNNTPVRKREGGNFKSDQVSNKPSYASS